MAVAIKNISTHGFQAEVFETFNVAERVWLTLPGLEGWEARVAWSEAYRVGCKFMQPLHPAVLNIILAKARTIGPVQGHDSEPERFR